MAERNLALILRAKDSASADIKHVSDSLSSLGKIAGGLTDTLGKIGLAAGGISALTSVAKGAADAFGFGLNSQFEQTKVKLTAMTGSVAGAEEALKLIQKEAAATPFKFAEMAEAMASLTPASKQSGVAIMDLVKQAEVLAASNPAQGLEGAAMALREALSGDFVSVVERFNLPRNELNKLKAEGVPAVEAIRRVMAGMGLDMNVVTGLSQTFEGRWSTITDTFDTLRAKISKPMFDILSKGLVDIQGALDGAMPKLEIAADLIGEGIAAFFTGSNFQAWYDNMFKALGPDAAGMITAFVDPLARVRSAISDFLNGDAVAGWAKLSAAAEGAVDLASKAMGSLIKWVGDNIGNIVGKLAEWAGAFLGWIGPMIPKLLAKAGEMFDKFTTWISDHSDDIAEKVKEWVPKLISFVSGASKPLIDEKLPQLLLDIGKWVKEKGVPAITKLAVDIGKGFVEGIWNGIKEDWAKLPGKLAGLTPIGAVGNFAGAAAAGAFGPKNPRMLELDPEADPLLGNLFGGVAGITLPPEIKDLLTGRAKEVAEAAAKLADAVLQNARNALNIESKRLFGLSQLGAVPSEEEKRKWEVFNSLTPAGQAAWLTANAPRPITGTRPATGGGAYEGPRHMGPTPQTLVVQLDVDGHELGAASTRPLMRRALQLRRNGAV